MKETTKKIWVSEDGKEFLSEFDCRMYELEEKFDNAISETFYCDDFGSSAITSSGITSAMDLLNFMRLNPELIDEILLFSLIYKGK